ncbi:XRE family transcriptional regulator [Deltaproteobacteria bacterium Smac51]|nr:XRE family transcriptional regulator [Deltaproteobacteria bacterium Smac51]
MLNYVLIGKCIGETRRLRKISQAQLAELASLSVSHISFIESAKRKVSLQSLTTIARVMGTTPDGLLAGNLGNKEEYNSEIVLLMKDCTSYEKRIIFEQLLSLKSSLRENRDLLNLQASTACSTCE